MAALLVLISACAAWWAAWRITKKIAKQRDWASLKRYFFCIANGCAASFAAFCIAGGLLLPDPENAGHIVASFGACVLATLTIYLWRASQPAQQQPSAADLAPQPLVAPAPTPAPAPSRAAVGHTPLLPCRFSFEYRDASGRSSRREVNVTSISSQSSVIYLEGFCELRQQPRTFRSDRIDSDLTNLETGEIICVSELLAVEKPTGTMSFKPPSKTRSTSSNWETAVLFTGFSKSRRDELEAMAYSAGWDVRSTVGSTLDYLVCGPKAGPSKTRKAEELGISIIDEFEFEELINEMA